MDFDEPHLMPNEKTQPIQWNERLIVALLAVGSLWPIIPIFYDYFSTSYIT